MLGSAAYYPKEGELPAATFGITPSFDVPLENFMAYKLDEEAPDIYGVMKYAGEFGIV